jgi:hypothetical protein
MRRMRRYTWLAVCGSSRRLALWWLDIDSELVFAGDAGTTEASRPSRRCGIELTNCDSPRDWLSFDADFSFSHACFDDSDPAGRYFGPRPLIENDSVESDATALVSARVGYEFDETWQQVRRERLLLPPLAASPSGPSEMGRERRKPPRWRAKRSRMRERAIRAEQRRRPWT